MSEAIVANASPDKHFFVESLTKDITLLDCVLDLIDNSIDSVSSHLNPGDVLNVADSLKNSKVKIDFDKNAFTVTDNGKGIELQDAIDTVFRFGSIKKSQKQSIGYYGIGLKRAIFKMGKEIFVESTSKKEKFQVTIEVENWTRQPGDWSFPIEIKGENGDPSNTGVGVLVQGLYPEISESFGSPVFTTKLSETIGRDYYFFLRAGLEVWINGNLVKPAQLELKTGGDFKPGVEEYTDQGVEVKIVSGCHSTFEAQNTEDAENFDPKISGWYVICNNRIILAANKDDKTIWRGRHENFTYWHPQYNGFVGFIFFSSADPKLLPWTTTKRYVDLESTLYRSALPKMLEMTKPWIRYTQQRKADIPKAKQLEETATKSTLGDIIASHSRRQDAVTPKETPSFPVIQSTQADYYVSIQFKVEKSRVEKCKIELGNPSMSNGDLGKQAFEYFYSNEIG
ncbi:ATP-binding protein [Dawidia soli]|uniref:ATP-binding protein n=1 Tax=Dawidia soli TaxID=2782352 RepID=A0AAP2DC36_9BACT|nr:ATP-binding protein [Dawidia soli]MBT1688105.1 ATP-binding protein [Dawidia soli]